MLLDLNKNRDRLRLTEADARTLAAAPSSSITHLLSNDDETFSVMFHVVYARCDYCDEQGDCRGDLTVAPVAYREDPYARQQYAAED